MEDSLKDDNKFKSNFLVLSQQAIKIQLPVAKMSFINAALMPSPFTDLIH